MVKVVLGLLIILTIFFAVAFLRDYIKATKEGNIEKTNFFALGVVGFITNFFDTLGIGSFSPTTALLKNFKLSKDRTLPGTLNVACTVPVAAEAILFINGIEVEPVTLFSLLIAATVGAVVAAGVVSKLDERKSSVCYGNRSYNSGFSNACRKIKSNASRWRCSWTSWCKTYNSNNR